MTSLARRTIPGIVLIVLMTFAAYIPAMRAGFIWDDDRNVTENEPLRSLDGLRQIWFELGATQQYYPLVHTSFWVEYRLWHLNPLGYHVVNVILHAVNALLAWAVLRRLGIPGAWFAASIFALHPVQVESVAWITERKNVLSGFFYFLALLAYIRFAGLDAGSAAPAKRGWYYGAALVLFLCALLSKTTTCALPPAILLLLWWKRDRLGWGDVTPLVPMFVAGAGLAAITGWVEVHLVGARGSEFDLSWADRCLIAGRAVWFYLAKLIWPTPLMTVYPRWTIDPRLWWQYLYPAAVVVAVVSLWLLRGRIGKGPLVAGLFFIGTLVPALGFTDVFFMRYTFVTDHWQYLACLGPIVVFAAALTRSLFQKSVGAPAGEALRGPSSASIAISGTMGVILAVLGFLTWRQGHIYKDTETVWRDALAKNPSAWMAHNNFGTLLIGRGEIEKALAHLETTLQLNPRCAEAHHNIGWAHLKQEKIDEAIKGFSKAIEVEPNLAIAHHGLAVALARQGKFDEAIEHGRRAVEIKPTFPEAYCDLGDALIRRGRLEEAVTCLREALKQRGDYAEAHATLGRALAEQGKTDEAIAQFTEALRLNPDRGEVRTNLGLALVTQGKVDEAMEQFREAIRLKPDAVKAHYNLGLLFARRGNNGEAIKHLAEAVRLAPQAPDGRYHLGVALGRSGEVAEAVVQIREALRIQPDNAPAQAQLANLLVRQKKIGEALDAYRAALRADPGLAAAANNLAWILATHPDPAFRNGAEAVQVAERACGGIGASNAGCLDTLAAAYAEAGRFKDAAETARKALALIADGPNRKEADAIAQRLKLYEAGTPYRSPP